MSWARLDDAWWSHRKTLETSLAARGLWATALSWSCHQRTDRIPQRFLAIAGATQDQADELVDAGFWIPDDHGWRIHDWHHYQDLSTIRAEAGRKGGRASAEKRKQQDQQQGQQPGSDESPSDQRKQPPDDQANDEANTQQQGQAGPARPGPAPPGPTQPGPTEPLRSDSETTDDQPPRRDPEGRDPTNDDQPDVDDQARQLTRRFARAVKANGHTVPKQGTQAHRDWLVEMDRLLRLGPPGGDSPTPPDEIAVVIDWATTDDFERANVLSVPKFRKRYTQLRLKAINATSPNGKHTSSGDTAWDAAQRYRQRQVTS